MTVMGSGKAYASIRSISLRPSTASSNASAMAWICGRICATILGVNTLETNRLSRVWSRGSHASML
jgi:hypothetical protein